MSYIYQEIFSIGVFELADLDFKLLNISGYLKSNFVWLVLDR